MPSVAIDFDGARHVVAERWCGPSLPVRGMPILKLQEAKDDLASMRGKVRASVPIRKADEATALEMLGELKSRRLLDPGFRWGDDGEFSS